MIVLKEYIKCNSKKINQKKFKKQQMKQNKEEDTGQIQSYQ